jgi:hypothetical protein
MPPCSARAGPLQNGNFEDSPDQSQMSGSVVAGEHAISGWKTSGHIELVCSGQKQGDMVLTVPDGAQALRLGAGASIEQQISGLTQGSYYSLTFAASRTCSQDETLSVTAAPAPSGAGSPAPAQTGELPMQTVYTSTGWDSYSWAFRAEGAGLMSVVITHNCGQEEDPACGPIVDAFAIKALHDQPPDQAAADNNMLRNGGFEEGPYIPPGSPWGVLVPPVDEDPVSPLPGWKVMAYKKSVRYVDSAHFAVPRGARAVELVSGVEAALLQEVDTTVEGSWYRLEFSAGDAANGCASSSDGSSSSGMKLKAYAGTSETTVDIDFRGAGGSNRGKIEFRAAASPTRVVFVSLGYHTKSDNSGTLCGPVVDDVSLVPIPPPNARRLLL